MSLNLLGSTSRVETPILFVTIGKYTFGTYSKGVNFDSLTRTLFPNQVIYPNYMKSLSIEKINGTVNTYTINMLYAIRNGDDPNLFEKVFSSVSNTRLIKITYGDASIPSSIFKDEEAIITRITNQFNISTSTISYTIYCTSKALSLNAGTFPFGKVHMKPSEKIFELLKDTSTGLQDIFYGMRDLQLIKRKGLIAGDDKEVDIEAKTNISILEYLQYLVNCMTPSDNTSEQDIDKGMYMLNVVDDVSQEFGGPYFEVRKVVHNPDQVTKVDLYEMDIGTLSKDMIRDFSIDSNETYSILYNYSRDIQQPQYIYRIDNNGEIDYSYSPAVSNSSTLYKTTQSDKT